VAGSISLYIVLVPKLIPVVNVFSIPSKNSKLIGFISLAEKLLYQFISSFVSKLVFPVSNTKFIRLYLINCSGSSIPKSANELLKVLTKEIIALFFSCDLVILYFLINLHIFVKYYLYYFHINLL